MNERRRERLAAFVREEIAYFFQTELELPTGAFLSVLYVEVAETGSRANVFVSVYPPESKEGIAKILKLGENKATHYMRAKVRSKYSPVIHFQIVENGSMI